MFHLSAFAGLASHTQETKLTEAGLIASPRSQSPVIFREGAHSQDIIVAQAADSNPSNAAAAQPACAANFSATGNFFTGKQFKTQAPLPGLTSDSAYKKTYAEALRRGWQIVQSDKEMHVISANQQVAMSRAGKTIPINILIQDGPSRDPILAVTMTLAGGLAASEDSVRDDFCVMVKNILTQ